MRYPLIRLVFYFHFFLGKNCINNNNIKSDWVGGKFKIIDQLSAFSFTLGSSSAINYGFVLMDVIYYNINVIN